MMADPASPLTIAWLTPVILKEAAEASGSRQAEGGTWLDTLFDQLRLELGSEARFHVFYPSQQVSEVKRYEVGNATYYLMPRRKYGYRDDFRKEVADLAKLLQGIQPDLLHIHGTEEFYGLVASEVSCPSVVSLQGFRDDIWRCYFGDITPWEYIWLHVKARRFSFFRELSYYRKMVEVEKKIFAKTRYYIGRTHYDRMHSLGRNPEGIYFGDCHDILRPAFYERRWAIEQTLPYSIHTTMTERPYKGLFLLIEGVRILKKTYPQVKMFVAGSMNGVLGRRAQEVVRQQGLEENVIFLGRCSSVQITDSLLRSRVFALGSFVENESLSLQEAQSLGMPSVIPWVGGLPTMMSDGREGFYYSTGDAYYLAGKISEIFEDEALAVQMGEHARRLCLERNDPARIGPKYKQIYAQLTGQPQRQLSL
jgi:glycosyltransferase involved in cell wall biosynthesis